MGRSLHCGRRAKRGNPAENRDRDVAFWSRRREHASVRARLSRVIPHSLAVTARSAFLAVASASVFVSMNACGDRTALGVGVLLDAGADATSPLDASPLVDAAVDGNVARDAGVDAATNACTATGACAGPFPPFDDRCVRIDDCVLVQHTVSCCGSRIAIGIRASQKTAFDAAEATWRATNCQEVCDCKAAPLCDDVGHACGPTGARAECSAGRCRSICQR